MLGNYSLGHRVLYLGKLFEQSFQLSATVEPVLYCCTVLPLRQKKASYYVLNNGNRLCLFMAEPSKGLRETRLAGTSSALDDTAVSQLIRLWGLGKQLFHKPHALPLFTAGVRDAHIAVFATPIFGAGDKFMAALVLSGPASRLIASRSCRCK